jgi:outer membrane protein assembly factor BamB
VKTALLAFGFAAGAPAIAATVVTLVPVTGHPNLPVTVSGSGFGASEAVDVYVDTVDTLLAVSSATGTIKATVTMPASAQPGSHYITAIGRKSGDAAQTVFKVSTNWIESGFGAAHLAWNPYENTLSTSVVPSLELQWAAPIPYCWGSPAVVNGTAYVGSGSSGGFFALNAATGAVKWSVDAGASFYGAPVFAANVVYVEDTGGVVHAFNAANGTQLWTVTLPGGYSVYPLVFASGILYAPGNDTLFAISTSGSLLWSYQTVAGVVSSAAIGAGRAFFTSTDGHVYALNASTGALLWSHQIQTGPAEGQPALANGVVYVGDYQGNVYALRAGTGTTLWTNTTSGTIFGTPAVANGVAYVTDGPGNLHAFVATSGASMWSVNLGEAAGYGGPAVADGVVYAAAGTLITAVDAKTGQYLVGVATGNGNASVPVVVNGMLYVSSLDGNLYAFVPGGAGANALHRGVAAPSVSSLHPDLTLLPVH